jgi:hypothetical protein
MKSPTSCRLESLRFTASDLANFRRLRQSSGC